MCLDRPSLRLEVIAMRYTFRAFVAFLVGLTAVTSTLAFGSKAQAATVTGAIAQSRVVSITGGYSSTETQLVTGWNGIYHNTGGSLYRT